MVFSSFELKTKGKSGKKLLLIRMIYETEKIKKKKNKNCYFSQQINLAFQLTFS